MLWYNGEIQNLFGVLFVKIHSNSLGLVEASSLERLLPSGFVGTCYNEKIN
jgi:hypothetical protein